MLRSTVLLDANVLWSPQQRNLILQIAAAGAIRVRWSREIENEWLRNTDDRTRSRLEANTLPLIRDHFPDALVEEFDADASSGGTDGKDRHVAAAAKKVAPSILVTWNLKDFDAEFLANERVRVMSPDRMLAELYDANPELIVEIAREAQANLTKSAPTWDDYLGVLFAKNNLREFVGRLKGFGHSPPGEDSVVIEAISNDPESDPSKGR